MLDNLSQLCYNIYRKKTKGEIKNDLCKNLPQKQKNRIY